LITKNPYFPPSLFKIIAATTALVYRKTAKISPAEKAKFDTGAIMNFMSADTARLGDGITKVHLVRGFIIFVYLKINYFFYLPYLVLIKIFIDMGSTNPNGSGTLPSVGAFRPTHVRWFGYSFYYGASQFFSHKVPPSSLPNPLLTKICRNYLRFSSLMEMQRDSRQRIFFA
jgi:hypothetical protein